MMQSHVKTRSTQRAQTSLAEADHYSNMPTVKMLSLVGKRLTLPSPPPQKKKKKKKKKKSFGSLPAPRSGYATAIMVFFAHLLILEYSDQHQNLISSSINFEFHSNPFTTF